MTATKILIADDTTLMRRLLAQALSREADMEVIAEAEDGRQAVELTLALGPDVVVTDLNMPHMNGVEAMEKILAVRPETKIILLTAHEDLLSLGRLSGAVECLDKSCTPHEVAAAVRRATAAKTPGREDATPGIRSTVERLSMQVGLTEREKNVLHKVVSTELTIGQISSALAAESKTKVSESAVKHTIERVMNKLHVEPRTRAALVRFVMERSQSVK